MDRRAAKSAAADEIAAIEDLMGDLEQRLRRLSGNARREARGATGDVGEFVGEALDRIVNRVRHSAGNASADLLKKAVQEIEHHPLVFLGVAAGIGLIAGLTNRR
jgi:ElaB/YqjD/DUF883 family membrane-anchored ribosome-binding protein